MSVIQQARYKRLQRRLAELEEESEQLTLEAEELETFNENARLALGEVGMLAIAVQSHSQQNDTPRKLKTNGMFTDALKYGAGRIDKRKARKQYEKASARDAKSKARLDDARKRLQDVS